MTFTGVLTKIELINPHSWIYFEVKEADGKMSKHRCEMRSRTCPPFGLVQRSFPVGADQVKLLIEWTELVLPEHDPLANAAT